MSDKTMREIDTETPVIWPAWCYTGEATIEESAHSATQLTASTTTTTSNKIKAKRKTVYPNSIDKMLSDRMMNVLDNRSKYCDSSTNNLCFDNSKTKCEISMEVIRHDDVTLNNNNNNNNNIKTERLSPQNGDVLTSNSRSRSATPSSYPGTPPQQINSSDNLHANLTSGGLGISSSKTEFQPRNYSDFIRSLAAKYNNANPNEPNNSRSFFEPNKFGINTPKATTKEPQSPPENKRLSSNVSQISNQNTAMSSIFPGIPFPTAVFSPLIDMSSTQALVTLARAAKEAEFQNLLKTTSKKLETTPPNNHQTNCSNTTPISNSTPHSSRFPFQSSSYMSSMQNINQHRRSHSPSAVLVNEQITSPLDLSAVPVTKRLKLESPSPSRSIESPINQQQHQLQQQQQRNKVSSQRKCQSQCEEINSWSVEQVCDFVSSIDICAEYTENFREQRIDGTGLPLLTEDHLMNSLGMKLGPALKLRSVLAKKSGGPCPCVSCSLAIGVAQSPSGGSMPRPSSADSGT